MPRRSRSVWALVLVLMMATRASAQGHHHYSGGMGGGGPVGWGHRHHHHIPYQPPIFFGWAPWGLVPYAPPIAMIPPGAFFPPVPLVEEDFGGLARSLALRAPFGNVPTASKPIVVDPRPKRTDPTRSAQMITLGDRLFRGGNLKRATERYEQGLQANPDSAAPHVRLAQVALMRGKYTEAANQFREAQAAEPGWLVHAPDIQAIYGEPSDFAAPIAKLETHLQVHPNDRDAWLVLGAQWYLSGRTRRAADVFNRLTDRPADPTLTAFLDATTPQEPVRH